MGIWAYAPYCDLVAYACEPTDCTPNAPSAYKARPRTTLGTGLARAGTSNAAKTKVPKRNTPEPGRALAVRNKLSLAEARDYGVWMGDCTVGASAHVSHASTQ